MPEQDNKIMVIINPHSGQAGKAGLDEIIRKRLEPIGYQLTFNWTRERGDTRHYSRRAIDEGYMAVIVCGGDGTINECASELCNSRVAMGILPAGSGNGLARHLNIPPNLNRALKIIESGHINYCDYGTVNDRPFFCTAGLGFDAKVSDKFDKSERRGMITYMRSIIREYRRYKPQEYVISIGGQTLTEKAFIVAICNASQYGNNAYIAPHASMLDGFLDITIVHQGNLINNVIAGVDLMTGYIYRNVLVDTLRTSEATISAPEGAMLHLDGEPMHFEGDLSIKCMRHGLKIYTPSNIGKFYPVITPIKMAVAWAFGTLFNHQSRRR